jgi:hypothetical protein
MIFWNEGMSIHESVAQHLMFQTPEVNAGYIHWISYFFARNHLFMNPAACSSVLVISWRHNRILLSWKQVSNYNILIIMIIIIIFCLYWPIPETHVWVYMKLYTKIHYIGGGSSVFSEKLKLYTKYLKYHLLFFILPNQSMWCQH